MKTILLVLTVLASALDAPAQGLILFDDASASLLTRVSTNSVEGGPATGRTAVAGGLYYYALFYSTTATTVGGNSDAVVGVNGFYAFDDPNWNFVALGTNGVSPGRFLSTVQNTDGSTTVSGVPGNSAASFVVAGWSASMGTNLAAVKSYFDLVEYDQNDWIGQSSVSGLITVGNGTGSPPALLFGLTSPNIPGFT